MDKEIRGFTAWHRLLWNAFLIKFNAAELQEKDYS